ncbi:hypothetical protein VTI74DRAFT_2558 [Chaetomium olivicolor]
MAPRMLHVSNAADNCILAVLHFETSSTMQLLQLLISARDLFLILHIYTGLYLFLPPPPSPPHEYLYLRLLVSPHFRSSSTFTILIKNTFQDQTHQPSAKMTRPIPLHDLSSSSTLHSGHSSNFSQPETEAIEDIHQQALEEAQQWHAKIDQAREEMLAETRKHAVRAEANPTPRPEPERGRQLARGPNGLHRPPTPMPVPQWHGLRRVRPRKGSMSNNGYDADNEGE